MGIELGDVRIDVIRDGTFRLDGGAMFGVVPKPLWSKVAPADDRNRIHLALNTLLVRTRSDVVLVDTGMGSLWSDKERDIYALENQPGLLDTLHASGVRPEDVTLVINTHLHFDHAGGNTRAGEGGALVPTFPKARYVVQRDELVWAKKPTLRDRASYLPASYAPIEEAGRLETIEGDAAVLPGIRVRKLPGHTPHLQGVLIEAAGETVFFPSDLVPTVAHLPFPWVMGYDLMPLVTLETKIQALGEAARGRWIIVFQHEPNEPVGRIRIERERPTLIPGV